MTNPPDSIADALNTLPSWDHWFDDELWSEFERIMEAQLGAKQLPQSLYHFTDADGLVGILKERVLWATLTSASTDASEAGVAPALFRDGVNGGWLKLPNINMDLALAVSEVSDLNFVYRAYVSSFCRRAEAAHWLHYGRSGTGMALGFDTETLRRIPKFTLMPVLYEPSEQRALITGLGEMFSKVVDKFSESSEVRVAASVMAGLLIRAIAATMKSPAFRSEDEFRLFGVHFAVPGLETPSDFVHETHFRTSHNRVVPYVKAPFPPSALKEIQLGAACPMAVGEPALKILAQESGTESVEITRATVEVRP